jgi:general stress protein YciG
MPSGNFKDDRKRASEAGKKGGHQSHGGQQHEQSQSHSGQQGGSSGSSSGQRSGSHEQHVRAGKQSHKNS